MVRIALDTNVMAYAEGVGDARRCKAARNLVARLPGHLIQSVPDAAECAAGRSAAASGA
jgi:hypothetical protein